MGQDPLSILIVFAVSFYVAKLWLADYRKKQNGVTVANAFPGAVPATIPVVLFGVIAAVILVLIESGGEWVLGFADQQSTVTWLFLLAMVSAAFIEELFFRGFLVIDGRGRSTLVGSIVGFSALFALLHFHWVEWRGVEAGWFELTLTKAAGWWTLALFVNALLFYWLRFCRWNPNRSLVPCFAAHIASNVGVFCVKLAQGFVTGIY